MTNKELESEIRKLRTRVSELEAAVSTLSKERQGGLFNTPPSRPLISRTVQPSPPEKP